MNPQFLKFLYNFLSFLISPSLAILLLLSFTQGLTARGMKKIGETKL